MQQKTFAWIFLKGIIVLIIFGFLHFIYELVPILPFAVIGGVNESVFQHMKLAYFAYLFTVLIEFWIFRKRIGDRQEFWSTRLLTVLLFPWMEFLIWYILPVFIDLHSLALELTYSLIVLYVMCIFAGILDFSFSEAVSVQGRRVLILLNIIAIFIFVAFSFTDPYTDVFYKHGH